MNISDISSKIIIFLVIGSMFLISMLPSSALHSDPEYIPIEITADDFINMYQNGDLEIEYSIEVNGSASYYLYDMINHTQATHSGNGDTYSITNGWSVSELSSDRLQFYTKYAYVQRKDSSSTGDNGLTVSVVVKFPFQYIFQDTDFGIIKTCYSGLTTSTFGFYFSIIDGNNTSLFHQSSQVNRQSMFWSAVPTNTMPDIRNYFNAFNWIPGSGTSYDEDSSTGIKTAYSYIDVDPVTTTVLSDCFVIQLYIDSYRDSSGQTGNLFSYYAPVLFEMDPSFTVYVEKDYEDLVTEYLDAIAGPPSSENQQKIEDLKDHMSDSVDNLSDIADGLEVDVPDVSDKLGELDPEVFEGVNDVAENIMTPMMTTTVVSAVIAIALIFAYLKLLLFGSGPS